MLYIQSSYIHAMIFHQPHIPYDTMRLRCAAPALAGGTRPAEASHPAHGWCELRGRRR